ncbi:MAG TPA: peptide ABC transporter substrate-binding protein [Ktedonosporobacter sp.]|nr:peptide ABC transporter substrate-binding protein [Ktedonosporobacter sp.]
MFLNQKHFTIRLLPLTLCLLVLTACNLLGENNPPTRQLVKAPPDKQVYTLPEVGITDFDTLDPALAHDDPSIHAVQMIFTGLVQLDDHLQVSPALAQTWEQSADGLSWTFHLKPNLKFSDGASLTSGDVAYSIDRALQPATQSALQPATPSMISPLYLDIIKDSDQLWRGKINTLVGDSIQTPDANTVVIIIKKKAAYFLPMLTLPCASVVEQSLINKYGAKFTDHLDQGGGAGPFKVEKYTHQVSISFVPNANYSHAKPQLQRVIIAFYHSANETYKAYQDNKLDMTATPIATLATDRTRKDFVQVPQLWTDYYTMNYLVKPFDNIHIRQAFALAIDKNAIAKTVWHDTVLPTNHIMPQGMPGFNPQLTGPDGTQNLSGNTTKAQELLQQGLQEEGWTNVTQIPPITLTYISDVPDFDNEVAALIQDWKKVLNLTVSANPIEYSTLLDKISATNNTSKGLQMWGLAWVGEYPDPQNWLTHQFGRGVPYNNMNYGQNSSADATQQQAIQQQLENADAETQDNVRAQMYQQAEQQLVNDVAWLPMEQVTATFLRDPNIVGIVENAQGQTPPDDWAKIYRVQ